MQVRAAHQSSFSRSMSLQLSSGLLLFSSCKPTSNGGPCLSSVFSLLRTSSIVLKQFQLRFSGGDVKPSTVPAHELADLLVAAEQTLMSLVSDESTDFDPSALVVGLVAVHDSSLGLEFASNRPDVIEPAFRRLTHAVRDRSFENFPSRGIAGLEVFGSFNARRNCRTLFFDDSDPQGAPVAVLPEDFLRVLPPRSRIRGETVIFGKVERVGGVEPKVRLRLSEHESFSCFISEPLARQLGPRLYEEVGLKGQATWDATDWSLLYFHGEEITPYEATPLTEAFTELRELAADSYSDLIDVEEHVRSLRYSEGQ